MSDWKFKIDDVDSAERYYNENGFVGFSNLLRPEEVTALSDAFDEAVADGRIVLDPKKIFGGNDAIFFHPLFESLVCDERISSIVKRFIGTEVELQHSKLNCKPLKDEGEGEIAWHQDYPFFPHTNYDLIAVGIHLDAEDVDSGPVRVIPGTHKAGPLSHCTDETFNYQCTEDLHYADKEGVLLEGEAGLVTMHHCLTLHTSAPKKNDRQRRLLVLQYRAVDAIQLAGVIWKCTGYQVMPSERKGLARFVDNTSVEIRGKTGRLYDKFQKLKPDDVPKSY